MEIIIGDRKQFPNLQNVFILNIDGYWGDGDQYHKDCHRFENSPEGLENLRDALTMLDKYDNQHDIPGFNHSDRNGFGMVEAHFQIERSKLFTEGEKEQMRDILPTDEGNMLLRTVTDCTLQYFDENGIEREVTVNK